MRKNAKEDDLTAREGIKRINGGTVIVFSAFERFFFLLLVTQ